MLQGEGLVQFTRFIFSCIRPGRSSTKTIIYCLWLPALCTWFHIYPKRLKH